MYSGGWRQLFMFYVFAIIAFRSSAFCSFQFSLVSLLAFLFSFVSGKSHEQLSRNCLQYLAFLSAAWHTLEISVLTASDGKIFSLLCYLSCFFFFQRHRHTPPPLPIRHSTAEMTHIKRYNKSATAEEAICVVHNKTIPNMYWKREIWIQ